MKIIFHTNNIDQTFYRQMIHKYISEQIFSDPRATKRFVEFRNSWEVHIHPAQDWDGRDYRSGNTGTLNPMIPHGVTGEGIIKAYIFDSSDKGLTSIQNFSAIYHEIAHMLMMILFRGIRGVMRNDDLGGLKKGQSINVSTQEVHDRQMEGRTYPVRAHVNFGNWLFRNWQRYTSVGIDLRDYIAVNL